MNEQNIPSDNRIYGFCRFNNTELTDLSSSLGLFCDLRLLGNIQEYYLINERRDPTVEELKICLGYSEALSFSPELLTVAGFGTDVCYENDTFCDMISKLKNHLTGVSAPYSLAHLNLAANICLMSYGKARRRDDRITSGIHKEFVTESISPSRHMSRLGDISVCYYEKRNDIPKKAGADDVCLLVHPENEMTEYDFENTLQDLILHLDGTVCDCSYIANGGILGIVLSLANGATIDLSNTFFSQMTAEAALCRPIERAAVITASPEFARNLIPLSAENGLHAFAFIKPNITYRVCVSTNDGADCSIGSVLLRKSAQVTAIKLHTVDNDVRVPSADNLTVNGVDAETVINGGVVYSAASCGKAGYINASAAVVEAVSRLVAVGVSRENITASFFTSINGRNGYSDVISVLLGKYRAQAELSLADTEGRLYTDMGNEASMCVTVRADCPEKPVPNVFSGNGNKVYLLSPRKGDGGLPDFRDLRLLYSYVSKLITEGKAVSARAVDRRGLRHTVGSMDVNGVFRRSSDTDCDLCGSFVVETNAEVDGILLGETV